jgi:hypothetical protein
MNVRMVVGAIKRSCGSNVATRLCPALGLELSRLSASQRVGINQQILGLRNQDLGLNDRRKIYEGILYRSLQRR